MWSQGKAGCPVVIDNNSQQVMESPLFAHCMLLFTEFIHSINYSHVSANVFTELPHFIPSLIHCTCLYFVYWLPPSDHSVSTYVAKITSLVHGFRVGLNWKASKNNTFNLRDLLSGGPADFSHFWPTHKPWLVVYVYCNLHCMITYNDVYATNIDITHFTADLSTQGYPYNI